MSQPQARRADSLDQAQALNRRQFLGCGMGLGSLALGSTGALGSLGNGSPLTHFAPKAKRVIYLHQSGAPSQFETLDPKPGLERYRAQELPESIRQGQRLTTMTSGQASFPIAPSIFPASRANPTGTLLSSLMPHTARISDRLCIVRSMHTEAINHDPAITFCQTGSPLAGRPSFGAWMAYGLGSMNRDLPTFLVMVSSTKRAQPLYERLWGSGFLPAQYQGTKLRSAAEPVLYLDNPPGQSRDVRRTMLDDLGALNRAAGAQDPAVAARIEQTELAFRMQAAVPDLVDVSDEPASTLELYGPDVHKPGTYARNCLLARRMIERDVRFVQLYHMGWDHHGTLPADAAKIAAATDQPSAALVLDLERRGLLDDTLVIWGGEFGRTVYSQGALTATDYGRDHHPRCFSLWLAGGGIRPGMTLGATDEFSYNITEDPTSVHDLHATLLHLLGFDHMRLTYSYQGRDFRLTDVEGEVVRKILA